MIYLDTHIVVWLFAGFNGKLSRETRELMNQHELFISPFVRLELEYLYETQRVTVDSTTITADLAARLGLMVCDKELNRIVSQALAFAWTRNPFDRLIVAHASLDNNMLISQDRNICNHYAHVRG